MIQDVPKPLTQKKWDCLVLLLPKDIIWSPSRFALSWFLSWNSDHIWILLNIFLHTIVISISEPVYECYLVQISIKNDHCPAWYCLDFSEEKCYTSSFPIRGTANCKSFLEGFFILKMKKMINVPYLLHHAVLQDCTCQFGLLSGSLFHILHKVFYMWLSFCARQEFSCMLNLRSNMQTNGCLLLSF